MKKKKLMLTLGLAAALLVVAGCSTNQTTTSSTKASTAESTTESSVDLNALELPQLTNEVAANESLVEMTTSEGTIKIKLFPELAPKAVENFMTHAKDGYYDGLTFHRVIKDFMIQGGDPKGDGTGGESIWGEGFETEVSNQLYNIRGALSMARSQDPNSNGSQFFIVQNSDDVHDGLLKDDYPRAIIDAYKNGGYPSLDGQYTVFGQVIEGMDVVDKIAQVETDSNDKPTTDVKIESIKVLQEAETK
ncbi:MULTISPECIES: peptidylprolyl isomerase [Enterococcus]|uniref:Peptidyl-prolyl cis-trans isomerase n=1 Tax=Enterococcus thailandicus TaxID=417368 RepID=A0A179ETP8_ENTTH|nr:peptidylprolyl isomerase [Enterococcus thailandicus]MDT2750583.1 peptidylprolyl isomerase [Enterococcus thailandicus]MDT2775142.1 peptidylprolyl isomerase [Enterococcus thailandicus]MDT2793638.1 peptidylprolyl isomerase [Enterococcus thailandicus]MDT2847167.1 peptidylprolyl isomerase [Enterococcus thailandicus]OAQ56561.1 peptidylprolyl isomerase [Enterococcus thailandicus]